MTKLLIKYKFKFEYKLEEYLVNLVLITSYFKEYLDYVFNASLIIEVSRIALILYILALYLVTGKHRIFTFYSKPIFIFILFLTFSALLSFSSIVPFLYELNKLSILFTFIIYFNLKSNNIEKLVQLVFTTLRTIIILNLIVIILQYLISPDIVKVFGISPDYFNHSMRRGRMAGFILGSTIFGPLACLAYLISEAFPHFFHKRDKLIFIISILISSSKGSILVFLIIYLILKAKLKTLIPASFLIIVLLFVGYYINKDAFDSKIEQYIYVVDVITKSDYSNVDGSRIESRAANILTGLDKIKKSWPFPNGLGTWGDASAKYYSENSLIMSDSYLIHLIVENGCLVLIYLFIFFLPMFSFHSKRIAFAFFAFTILNFIFNMGLSSGGYPYLLSFFFALLLTDKTYFNSESNTSSTTIHIKP